MHATKISLTDFIDFVNRPSMSEKLTKVREIKHRGPYSSAGDFYRPVREAVIRTHATGRDKWTIRNTIERLANAGLLPMARRTSSSSTSRRSRCRTAPPRCPRG
jgi:hypothetical protein